MPHLCNLKQVIGSWQWATRHAHATCVELTAVPCVLISCIDHLQAVSFLVIHQKHNKSLEEITTDLCPVLSVQQLYRISTMYWDDRYGTETVSHEVLGRMKQLMVENNSAASHSFLLDDDSSIPFSLDDIQSLMDDKARLPFSIQAFKMEYVVS